jgi:hypothetical protein
MKSLILLSIWIICIQILFANVNSKDLPMKIEFFKQDTMIKSYRKAILQVTKCQREGILIKLIQHMSKRKQQKRSGTVDILHKIDKMTPMTTEITVENSKKASPIKVPLLKSISKSSTVSPRKSDKRPIINLVQSDPASTQIRDNYLSSDLPDFMLEDFSALPESFKPYKKSEEYFLTISYAKILDVRLLPEDEKRLIVRILYYEDELYTIKIYFARNVGFEKVKNYFISPVLKKKNYFNSKVEYLEKEYVKFSLACIELNVYITNNFELAAFMIDNIEYFNYEKNPIHKLYKQLDLQVQSNQYKYFKEEFNLINDKATEAYKNKKAIIFFGFYSHLTQDEVAKLNGLHSWILKEIEKQQNHENQESQESLVESSDNEAEELRLNTKARDITEKTLHYVFQIECGGYHAFIEYTYQHYIYYKVLKLFLKETFEVDKTVKSMFEKIQLKNADLNKVYSAAVDSCVWEGKFENETAVKFWDSGTFSDLGILISLKNRKDNPSTEEIKLSKRITRNRSDFLDFISIYLE